MIIPRIVVCTCFILSAWGGEVLTPADKSIRAYLAAQARALENDFLKDVKTAEDFEARRPAMRQNYLDMLGLWPLPEKTPLNPKTTGKIEEPGADGKAGYVVEKVHFQSRPGLYVTANLYLPHPKDHAANTKFPAILYQCGHSYEKRNGNKTAYQDQGIWFATHGYVALVTDSLQLGEIAAIHHGTYRENRWWWHSAGYTSAGVECWNGIRALDYLSTRPEVDAERFGASGISGGGSATFWISAADERIKASAPVSGVADLNYYVGEDGVNGHCDCMFLYNRARWNWTEIAALICPRPMLFVNSDNDPIFPMSANDRIINRLSVLYARFGQGDKVGAAVSIGGHAYRTDIRRAVYEFFNRHLKMDAKPVTDADCGMMPDKSPRIAKENLRVFPMDADIPADQLNTRIDQTFVPKAKPELPTAATLSTWRSDLLAKLKAATFSAWPKAVPESPVPALKNEATAGDEITEDGIKVQFAWHPGENAEVLSLIVLNPDETPGAIPEWAREHVGKGSALVVSPRGTGVNAWTKKSPPNTVERSLALLGATVDSGRVWDVVAIAKRQAGRGSWRVMGKGQAGIIGAYAALYEPAIKGVTLVNPPASHFPKSPGEEYGPALLNVLRVLDIPDALGCLAPRDLMIVGGPTAAFERTGELYKISGAEAKLIRK